MPLLSSPVRTSVLKILRRYQQVQAKVTPPSLPTGPVFRNSTHFPDRIAIRDRIASYTYANIFMSANELSKEITSLCNGRTGERVMFMCPNDVNYVITMFAIWMSGQIAVPLSPLHPKNVLLYYANDSNSKLLISAPEYSELMQKVVSINTNSKLHVLDEKMKLNCAQKTNYTQSDLEGGLPTQFYDSSNALILYTSGTTGSPKGVVISHKNIQYQTTTLIDAWKWSPNDVILHTLPLNHIHGIVNALLCPLYIGAKAIMLKKFNANTVWSYLLGINAKPEDRKISVYMAVPTIYYKLIEEFERIFKDDPKMVEYVKNTLKTKMRLMISGSAPMPASMHQRWQEISGHQLLQRYGMTECGMVLSQLYDSPRKPGYVGIPLPGVSARIVDENEETGETHTVLECTNVDGELEFTKKTNQAENHKGELLLKGDGIFKEYFNRPEATRKEFTSDGWFKTGDVSEYSLEDKEFKILGRKSVDIIKSGGYKLSALEIETKLLLHPHILECVVVGLDDDKWGQRVVAAVVLHEGKELTLEELREWAKDKMPPYWIPSVVKPVASIPKNAMGKVNKKDLIKSWM
ncbi:malonate--CoA ligase ACSF3, mitochondrial [Diabrotica virgifera virgifera]|uniref:Acyl-CoA synthetase family member 3, mitochondrial n=1 Tax=Diabrotica virgifera virgifera TaxID=50390 RepID=A0ABM5JKB0_DIAVI|nr:malonate--CoA ligase ACSF3, mitochondrial [Diabrotica virgifera virgifera]